MKSPIINSPYYEPSLHFKADVRGLTDEILEFRRPSSCYIPIPRARNKNDLENMTLLEGSYGEELQKENVFINKVRAKVTAWRKQGYSGITKTSRDLLLYWSNDERTNKLFFCQIEALETLMYLNEVAEKEGESWLINEIKKANEEANPGLYRIAFKMATGSGKTVVMAMIIAYNTLNKIRYPMDTRFTDAFAIISPGITIRDRLNVLQPNNEQNYYLKRDIVSHQDFELLQHAVVVIWNYHQLEQRQNFRMKMGAVTKVAGIFKEEALKESPSVMVGRAFKSLMNKPRILVINDEAHHCYREKPDENKLTGDDRKEADENNEAARVWISGLEALCKKKAVNAIIDLSATPYFLRGSGYNEGTLFPWTTYDFSLLDALESGVVKIPRLPVEQDNISKDIEFRNLWVNVRDDLPKKGMKTIEANELSVVILPKKLEEALLSLYGSYEKYYNAFETAKKKNKDAMPPVMIVVCNNTSVSSLVYRWISGWQKELTSKKLKMEKGHLDIFRNEDGVNFLEKPNTLLIDSKAIESGGKIDDNFKKVFEKEIKDFQREYKKCHPGRADEPTDEEVLREVMNTVGKPGKLGENIKCVVSVSMLTEGWDVNTVTHILGVRAFSTQLLCEQVVGRALRRVDYNVNANGLMGEEYAEVYGVPFSFLRVESGTTTQPPKVIHRVFALPERTKYEISFPRVEGYRYEIDEKKLEVSFTDESKIVIENEPTEVKSDGIVGESTTEYMTKIIEKREATVVTELTTRLLKRYYVDSDGSEKIWLFPQLKRIVEEYVKGYVVLKDKMVIGYLSIGAYASDAITKIYHAIAKAGIEKGTTKRILPILAPYNTVGSTKYVDFLTTKPVQETFKSHVNYMVADTDEWEQGVAKRLEQMPEVISYVKNQGLMFVVPYEHAGISRQYFPDFIVKILLKDKTVLNLILEVTGKKDDKKIIKVKTTKEFWVPAMNNLGKYGKWAILEIQDIHETQNLIRIGIEQGFDKIAKETLWQEKRK